MKSIFLFALRTAVFVSFGAILHRAFNSAVFGGDILLLFGLSAGVILAVVVLVVTYVVRGTLRFGMNAELISSGQLFFRWHLISCFMMIFGMFLVFVWNDEFAGPPLRTMSGEVIGNGERERKLLYFAIDFDRRISPPAELQFRIEGQVFRHTYRPDLARNVAKAVAGDTVQARFEVGGLGFPKLYSLSVVESRLD
jgi:hypothetical protein